MRENAGKVIVVVLPEQVIKDFGVCQPQS